MVTGALGPLTAALGASGAKATVPLPLPAVPALSTIPGCSPRLCEGMLLPLVSVNAEAIDTSLAAQIMMLPNVVDIAELAFSTALRPALRSTLPLVVVIAAFTLTSRPQQTTRLPLTAVIAWLTLTSRLALRVSVVVLGVAVQLTAWLTLMSPLPLTAVKRLRTGGVPATVASTPGAVLITTLLLTSNAESVGPLMLSVAPLPMVKSCGSISQSPVRPNGAAVVTRALSSTRTRAAEVSMKPPLPPSGALA